MSPPTILAFTKDWNDVPTCTTHVLREMGKTMPVLWINSIGTRKPSLASPRDFRRVARRVWEGFRRADHKENQLSVLSPVVLPKAQSGFVKGLNRRLLAWAVGRETRRMGRENIELWAFIPNAVDFAGSLGEKKIVYYCPDDWTKFTFLDANWINRCEQELLRKASVVFATSRYLVDKFRPIANDRVHYLPHGVNYELFSQALSSDLPIPADLAQIRTSSLQSPIIGFYGNLYDWIDFDLLAELARLRPAWNFVMIGPVLADITRFQAIANVHFLGRREPDQLPAYCKGFDVALIPYRLTDPRMESVNPVKLRELLAAGVPVVATDVPEIRGLSQFAQIAHSPSQFITALAGFIDENHRNPNWRREISEERRPDTWSNRVREIRRIVDAA